MQRQAGSPAHPEFSARYTRYALALLVLVYIFNFLDRQVLTILLEAIKRDLEASDFQLGMLTGLMFAVFYTGAGIPLARWADRGRRSRLIALALLVWSGMTALQGLAKGFATLALARVGVGIGEAGCSPAAHSMLADYFPPERRATALAIYALGIPIGGGIGLLAGGWLGEYFGWRVAFFVVGLPGVLLALVVRLTLREPTRGYWEPAGRALALPASAGVVARYLLAQRSFVHLSFGASLHALYGYGAATFNPSFFLRVHHFTPGELGTWLAGIALTTGALGTYLGGALGDRFGRRDARWYVLLPAAATTLGVPASFLFYLWPDGRAALALSIVPAVLGGMYLGPTFSLTQGLVPPQMRSMAAAVLLFILNLIGLGLGPMLVGAVSDRLMPTYGVESLRYALLWVVVAGSLWSTVHYVLAARTLRGDLARAAAEGAL